MAALEVGGSFDNKTRYQRFRSDWNLYGLCFEGPTSVSGLVQESPEGDFAHCYYSSCYYYCCYMSRILLKKLNKKTYSPHRTSTYFTYLLFKKNFFSSVNNTKHTPLNNSWVKINSLAKKFTYRSWEVCCATTYYYLANNIYYFSWKRNYY